jgi:hypothetical protein
MNFKWLLHDPPAAVMKGIVAVTNVVIWPVAVVFGTRSSSIVAVDAVEAVTVTNVVELDPV